MKKSFAGYFILCFSLLTLSCHKDKTVYIDKDTGLSITSNFVLPDTAVKLNPTGYAPLSALLTFTGTTTGHTEIVVKGMHGSASDVTQVFTDNSESHSIPILGLYANYKNTVEIYVISSDGLATKATITITTGGLPANVPNYSHVDTANRSIMEPGFDLVSGFSGYPTPPSTPYMMDSFGDIRWILDFSTQPILKTLFYDCGIARLQDGNYFFGDIGSKAIWEVDVFGKVIHSWYLGGYLFHHNVTEMPNGNFLVTVTDPTSTHPNGTPTIEDYVLEIDRASGNILNTWDLKQSLDEFRQTLGTDPSDWIHENGVIYDSSDNTIILSGRVQCVVKLTMDNQVVWILAPHRGWGTNRRGQQLSQYLLTPLDAQGNPITDTLVTGGYTNSPDFEWNWYQHCPLLLPNGDLMVFDNGTYRNYNMSSTTGYSRAVEFKIDPVKMTVQQIWAYGENSGPSTWSVIVSSVQYLPKTNHILFSPGYNVPNSTGSGGKIIEVDYATKKLIYQQSVSSANSWGWHRARRFSLYPNGNPYVQ